MATVLRMPAVAAGTDEAVLQEWTVADGAAFTAGDTLATVETDKALVDVDADADGVVLTRLVSGGARVQVGAPIAVLGDPGEEVDDVDALLARLGVSTSAGGQETASDALPSADGIGATDGSAGRPTTPGGRVFASPLARRMARDAGLAVAEIAGTGPGGRIIRRDVEAAIAARTGTAGVAAGAASDHAAPADTARHDAGPDVGAEVPHSRLRRAIAARLTESKQTAPHFYLRATLQVDQLLELRVQLNQASPVSISLNDLVVKAVAQAHVQVPQMNVVWTPDAVRTFSSVDIGIAVATDRGLVTPVLRSVDTTSVAALANTARDLVERAKAGQLRQAELEGGSFTVTNLGMYGVEEFTAIINPPQAAILAVGAAHPEPVVRDGGVVPATVLRVTLAADHRPVDGVVAAHWMRAFTSLVENPVQILL